MTYNITVAVLAIACATLYALGYSLVSAEGPVHVLPSSVACF